MMPKTGNSKTNLPSGTINIFVKFQRLYIYIFGGTLCKGRMPDTVELDWES